MLQFCSILSQKKPEAKFLFISNNNHQDIINAAAAYKIPPEKIMVKFGKRHEVPVLLSFSTYSLFFIKPCYSKLSSSPTKHGEIMAMGIPVITNSGVGDVKEIVEKYHAGFVLDEFTTTEMNKIAETVCDSNTSFNHTAIREGAEDFYNLETTLTTYSKAYKKVLG